MSRAKIFSGRCVIVGFFDGLMKGAWLVLLCLSVTPSGWADQQITLVTEDYPPLNYLNDGQLEGASVDIVRAIQNRIGEPGPIEVMPWKRAYNLAENNPNAAIFSIARSTKRESLFKWVGPIATKKYALYGLAERNFSVNDLQDVKEYVIGVQSGSRREEFMREIGVKRLHSVILPEQNMGKLLLGRIDLWYTSFDTLLAYKQETQNLKDVEEVFVVKHDRLFIGFNQNTPEPEVNKWRKAYEQLYNQDLIKSIFEKRNELHLYPKVEF